MGLDTVELVLECEGVFNISIDDHELSLAPRVGQLFELICTKLQLPTADTAPSAGINRLCRSLDTRPWTREDAWATFIGIFLDRGFTIENDQAIYRVTLIDGLG